MIWDGLHLPGLAVMLFGMVLNLVVIGAVIWLVIALVRRSSSTSSSGASSALIVLEERYARGEISREDFLERRAVLMNLPGDRSRAHE